MLDGWMLEYKNEFITEDIRYNPKCPCLGTCPNHGFCKACLKWHSHPPHNNHRPTCQREADWYLKMPPLNIPLQKIKDLPVGARVRDAKNQMVWLIAAHNHPGYTGTTLVAEHLVGAGSFDAKEPENPKSGNWDNVKEYGNNYYPYSNIRQWLNSAQANWYSPQHRYDAPPANDNIKYRDCPYDEKPGFLADFSPTFLKGLQEVEVKCIKKGAEGKAEPDTIRDKVFLLSRTEIGSGDESGLAEGSKLPLFNEYVYLLARPTTEDIRKYQTVWLPGIPLTKTIQDISSGWWYWLRSPMLKYEYLARVMINGAHSYSLAYNDRVGIRPALNLDSELMLSDTLDENGIYTLTDGER